MYSVHYCTVYCTDELLTGVSLSFDLLLFGLLEKFCFEKLFFKLNVCLKYTLYYFENVKNTGCSLLGYRLAFLAICNEVGSKIKMFCNYLFCDILYKKPSCR